MKTRFAEFELDSEQKSVTGPDGPITLRPQAFAVLDCLLQRAPSVVTRNELLDQVWGHQSTSVSSVSQTIRELRQALGDSSSAPRIIATRHRIGYQLIAEIQPLHESESPQPEPPVAAAPAAALKRPASQSRWLLIAGVAVVLALAVAIRPDRPAPRSLVEAPLTVAISEFENLTREAERIWLSSALKTFLGPALAEFSELRVVEGTGTADGNRIDYLIEGGHELTPQGETRITARLRRPGESTAMASVQLQHRTADVATLSVELARAIRESLGLATETDPSPSTIGAYLPREAAVQRVYFQALDALARGRSAAALDQLARAREIGMDNPFLDHVEALALEARGNIEGAREAMRRVSAATSMWPLRERLAMEATAARLDFRFELAADRLQALNQFFPEANSVKWMIDAQIRAGRYTAAAAALHSLGLNRPTDPGVALLSAALAEAENRPGNQLELAQSAYAMAVDAEMPVLAARALLAEARALQKQGSVEQALATLDRLDTLQEPTDDLVPVRATADLLRANILFQRGDLDQALALVDAAEPGMEKEAALVELGEAAMLRGIVHERAGRLNESIDSLGQAIEHFERVGDQRRQARAHVNLGITLTRVNQPDAALESLDRAGRFYRAINDRHGEAAALLNRGNLLARLRRMQEAENEFSRALEAFEDIGEVRGQAIAISNLAGIAGARGDSAQAIDRNLRALDLFRSLDADIDAARAAYNLGLVYKRQGELVTAEQMIVESAALFAEHGATLSQAHALTVYGSMLLSMGRAGDADAIVEQLLALDIEDAMQRAAIDSLRGRLALDRGLFDAAGQRFNTALELRREADSPAWVLASQLDLARVAIAQGRLVEGEQEARRLASEFSGRGSASDEIDAQLVLAEALIEQGRADQAELALARSEALLDTHPDSEQGLIIVLLRGQLSNSDLDLQRLEWVFERATRNGFEPIADKALALMESR